MRRQGLKLSPLGVSEDMLTLRDVSMYCTISALDTSQHTEHAIFAAILTPQHSALHFAVHVPLVNPTQHA
jgi:hypothetical protein